MRPRLDDRYLTAAEAAAELGVSMQTLYVYVGRKGIRSQPIPGSRFRQYWKADIERIKERGPRGRANSPEDVAHESQLTFLTERDILYRGRSAIDLSIRASFESVAALLWDVAEEDVFGTPPPATPELFSRLSALLAHQRDVDRITAILPLLEEANPRAYDLSPAGMARSGADILRWMAALTVKAEAPAEGPIHQFVADQLARPPEDADLIRRMLILSADHGFESGAYVVRAVASSGVSPWRAVAAGLSVSVGRRNHLGAVDAISRLLREIDEAVEPEAPIIQRIRDGEALYGFESPTYVEGDPIYKHGDPRAKALFRAFEERIGDDKAFRRLSKALSVAQEIRGIGPNNAIACLFLGQRLGLGPRSTLFHLGRAAGWVGHAIEQHAVGEIRHLRGVYTGPLPDSLKDDG